MKNKTIMVGIFTAAVALGAYSTAGARTKDELFKQADAEAQKICLSMQQYMEKPDLLKKITIEDNPEINAYAEPNGHITLFMGMVNFAQSADEFAMVCGHEETHISREHSKRSIGTQILATVVDIAIGGTPGNVAGTLIYDKKSRKYEREADRQGLYYAWKAGFDPYAGIDLWQGMSTVGGSMPLEKYLSTHPVDQERVENFKVQMYRDCKEGIVTTHCDDVMNDKEIEGLFNQFQGR